jgi:hypothetical protein
MLALCRGDRGGREKDAVGAHVRCKHDPIGIIDAPARGVYARLGCDLLEHLLAVASVSRSLQKKNAEQKTEKKQKSDRQKHSGSSYDLGMYGLIWILRRTRQAVFHSFSPYFPEKTKAIFALLGRVCFSRCIFYGRKSEVMTASDLFDAYRT